MTDFEHLLRVLNDGGVQQGTNAFVPSDAQRILPAE